MGWSGSGAFNRIYSWVNDKNANIAITASRVDGEADDFAAGIQACVAKNGENTATGNLPMGGYKHTGVGNAAARDSYAAAGQIQDEALVYGADTGAADAYAITPSPAITAYAAGQRFVTKIANANTGASTLAVSGLAAKSIKLQDGSALSANDLIVGQIAVFHYDGTNFQLINPDTLTAPTISGTWTAAGATCSDLGTVTTADINGGTIDGVTIGTNSACTELVVDNLNVNLNTISSTSGNINITPVAGSNITLDSTITIDAGVVSGITDLGTVGTADINGGTIDGTVIGGTTPAAASVTTLSASGDVGVNASSPRAAAGGVGNVVDIKSTLWIGDPGSRHGVINTADGLRINIDANSDDANSFFEVATHASDQSGGTSLFYVDDNGNVGIGGTPSAPLHITGNEVRLQTDTCSYSWYNTAGSRYGYMVGDSSGLIIDAEATAGSKVIIKTGGTTALTIDSSQNAGWSTTLESGLSGLHHRVGDFASYTAGSYSTQAKNWYYDGADKYIGNGFATRITQQDGNIVFQTAPNNTSGAGAALTWSTSATIDSSGHLVTPSITLGNGTTYAANKELDDYEEDDWTPSLKGTTTDPTVTVDAARYTKIGDTVHCDCQLTFTAAGSGTYYLQNSSLPFAPSAAGLAIGVCTVVDTGTAVYAAISYNGGSDQTVYISSTNTVFTSSSPFTVASGDVVRFNFTYKTAA